ncbi:putative RNase III [Tieghemostelium lacteum]|uniref:Putative RNase III n=1 Tax=Tieghemostelium lacteum TaxID=361077 RepID=A0A151ZG10_TIELA|nr:putative RNase III [Tieghemostelium lacteum]|eukprot:KYQ92804.1 putative RNase III [Tieghemostelium lacteum]
MSEVTTTTTSTSTNTEVQQPVEQSKEQYYEFLVILDFEATCEENAKWPNQEIIEFPSVIVNTKTLETVATFREYCKPVYNPVLTKFCTELTGIQQSTVDSADTFNIVLQKQTQFLIDNGLLTESGGLKSDNKFIYVTCGDWDLQQAIRKQSKLTNFQIPQHLTRWINIKKVFQSFYQKNSYGMANMLRELKMPLEGRHHCGLSDCLNIASICKRMISEGCIFQKK